MASRRQRRLNRDKSPQQTTRAASEKKNGSFYHDNYKKLLFIPFILLFLALCQIGYQTATTGDFLNKGVSLQGGLTLTIPFQTGVTIPQIEELLATNYPDREIVVRGISEFGQLRGVVIEAAAQQEAQELEDSLIGTLSTIIPTAPQDYSVEIVGPSLGAAFFTQTLKAVVIAFLLMGLVVFWYFGFEKMAKYIAAALTVIASFIIFNANGTIAYIIATILCAVLAYLYVKYSLPSAAVVLAALSDIIMTVAVVNMLGIKVSTAGIAAFLMLIGYSVDTDILLSTRVLKRTQGRVYDRVISSFKTGMTMGVTSLVAALIALIITQSETISQIMLIIIIGLIFDMINTWLQNAGIIRMYAEKRGMR